VLSCGAVSAAAQPFCAALLRGLFPNRVIVVVTDGLKTQESFQQDIATWLARDSPAGPPESAASAPLFFPAWEILPHELKLPHPDVISDRLQTLVALAGHNYHGGGAPLVVASVTALSQRTFPAEAIRVRTRTLARGGRIDPLELVEWLEDQGYEPEAQVTRKGEIALRGGILDVFPLTSLWPVRMEFFGDELESLRHFDPITQISRDETASVTIPPAGELGILRRMPAPTAAAGDSADPPPSTEMPVLGSVLDYLPPQSILLLCEPGQLSASAEDYARQITQDDPFYFAWDNLLQQASARGITTVGLTEADASETSLPAAGTLQSLELQSLDPFRPLAERAPEPQIAEAQRREFFAQLHRWLRQGFAVHVFCNNDGERQRFLEIWSDQGLGRESGKSEDTGLPQITMPGHRGSSSPSPPNGGEGRGEEALSCPSGVTGMRGLQIHIGALARGFFCAPANVVVVTDAEIFGRYKIQRPRRLKAVGAQLTRSALDIDFTELEAGDYVVHVQHGIGRYLGLEVLPAGVGTRPTEGSAAAPSNQECLVIEYAPSDTSQTAPKLYVPVSEAHLVGKYVGAGKARPPLNTLGGTRWAKAKAQAERAVRDLASDLLAIQAARDSQPGHAFTADTPWQREFEASFIFEETPDQLRAIHEAKADMERPKPMDRLICGDVGFGKTEVAIRAAFKAVMDGRQAAVLVPTTVLAQQHYNTFRERMADYPIRVELLSRFRTRREQERVVKDLAAGGVDIIIGTHRLVQEDVAFKDLGLVVIDEEQRFGVMHKEKFKLLRKMVDVLTLSATPIPRTLYLALSGARDLSTIQTPPHDRLPVETIVTAYDERLIRNAIQREINRGGQVFFLHNRVMTIQTMADKLRTLVPRARILVGHGQMHSDELEEVMTSFVNGHADVLLSTTIIESGLDIPNANTIIIDRADRFGLSDLYQLRGRVGRYKHQAFAYLLLPRHAGLLAEVRKRLAAIRQYSALGSGFKIAMRDLEIRGAGNLLGSEQSGHITAVGFELYCQLLKQSVAALKGEKVEPRIEVQVRLDFLSPDPGPIAASEENSKGAGEKPAAHAARPASGSGAFIPFRYISDTRQRIEIYRKLAQATDATALRDLEKELRDRFGPVPPPLERLIQAAGLKILAGQRGVTVMEVKDGKLMLTRNNDYVMIGAKFPRLTARTAAARLKEIKKLLLAL